MKRNLVGRLVVSDIAKALDIARNISDPWYRCQSLAEVAWHLKDQRQLRKVIEEALEAAYEQKEPNRIVSVAAWPVRVMVKQRDPRLGPVVDELLHRIQTEPNPVRRADALLLMFEATYHDSELRAVVLAPLLRACEQMNSWKRPRILSEVALVLAIDDPTSAAQVVEMMGECRRSRKTRREIAAAEWLGPHEFFSYYAKHTRGTNDS
jgi:hypothetical protein